jgi:SAM-dependent methyltransferase
MSAVVWHDLECGAYREDLPLWLRLASESGGPVLDVGAGTGRVTLELARAGHRVVALDRDPDLLDELARRAGGLPVTGVVHDAREFDLGRRFPLILVPMQTVQLLGGAEGRLAFLRCAHRHLLPEGRLVLAIAERFDIFTVADGDPGPLPDIQELEGTVYSSLPTAVRRDGDTVVLERIRERVDVAGTREVSHDVIALDRLSAAELTTEAELAGLRAGEPIEIPPTFDHVGSRVVVLHP